MSVGLRTGKYFYQTEEPHDVSNPLYSEFGWHEVAKGLSRLLLGYFLLVLSAIIGGIALYYAIYNREMAAADRVSKQSANLIVFFAITFLGISSLISFGLIIAAKWKCAMNAPERHAAKWLMVLCLLFLLTSPVLHFAFSMSGQGAENYQQMGQHGRHGFTEVHLEGMAGIMQLISLAMGLASALFFVLFLRAAACCFQSKVCLWVIHLYLVFSCLLIGVTFQVAISAHNLAPKPEVLILLGGGWVASFAWYILMIFVVRMSITRGMRLDYSPLALTNDPG